MAVSYSGRALNDRLWLSLKAKCTMSRLHCLKSATVAGLPQHWRYCDARTGRQMIGDYTRKGKITAFIFQRAIPRPSTHAVLLYEINSRQPAKWYMICSVGQILVRRPACLLFLRVFFLISRRAQYPAAFFLRTVVGPPQHLRFYYARTAGSQD